MSFLVLVLLTVQCAYGAMSPLARQMLVPDLTGKSFAETKITLEAHEASLAARVDPTARAPMRTGYTRYNLQDRKTPFVFVVIHGLFRNPGQFRHLYTMIEGFQQNVVYVNLPGHGMDMYAAGDATHHDWLEATRRATSGALHLGEKIIFLTQSTGGALSLIHALDHPETVAGLFMIEPALRVNPLVNTLVCLTHPVMPSLNWLYGLAGRKDDLDQLPYMGTYMGCQVDKLMSRYLRAHSRKRSRRAREAEIFPRIEVPVIIFNNMSDRIVSRNTIRRFNELVRGPRFYIEIPREGGSYHADEEFMFGVIQREVSTVRMFFEALSLNGPVQGL